MMDQAQTRRIAFALAIALCAIAFQISTSRSIPGHSDFSVIWYAAQLLTDGKNPYDLIGPGREVSLAYELHFPAPTVVAAVPLTFLSERWADIVFVFGSCFALAYGATKQNWNRVWIFPSAAFIVAARNAQWSPLIASGYFLPFMTPFLFLKPTSGFAVMTTWTQRRVWLLTGITSVLLLTISLIVLPSWPRDFGRTTLGSWEYTSPVTRTGGFLLLLSLLRWRSKEGRLLFVLSLVPMVSSWYEALLPMLVARSKRECQILSLTSSLGYLLMIPLALSSPTHEIATSTVGNLMIAFCYLPALIVVLKRPIDIQS